MISLFGERSNKRKGLVFEHSEKNSSKSARCDEVVRATFKKGLVLFEEEAPAWRVVKEQ